MSSHFQIDRLSQYNPVIYYQSQKLDNDSHLFKNNPNIMYYKKHFKNC